MAGNLPPGCNASDIPGNTPEDAAWEKLLEEIGNTVLYAADARRRWKSQPDLLAACKVMLAAADAIILMAHQHDPKTGFCKPVDPYEITRLFQTCEICIHAREAIAKAEGA